MTKITIDKAVLEQALEALNHGITEMNHRGCAIECMSLHHATKAIREELAQPERQSVPAGYVRFCPECGKVGEVRPTARDCCPDGSHAAYMPEKTAEVCSKLFQDLLAAAPQPQPVQEPVAYLDIGAGGYLDIATNLTDEQLLALPKGRHALVIAGTFGIDSYTSPQAQPTQPLTETQADALNTLCKMLHSGEEVEGDDGLAMLVPMDLWNEAQEAIELLIGEDDGTEAAHGITKGTT